jgi:hypothetical protein
MFQQPRSLKRSIVAGLTVCAIAPAGAVASPIMGSGVAAGGGPGVSAKDFPKQIKSAQVDRRVTPGPPTWPVNPQPIVSPVQHTTPATASDGGGLDTGEWIGLGGVALLATGGLCVVGYKRQRTGRQLA